MYKQNKNVRFWSSHMCKQNKKCEILELIPDVQAEQESLILVLIAYVRAEQASEILVVAYVWAEQECEILVVITYV